MGFQTLFRFFGRVFKRKPKRAALSEEDIRVLCAEWDADLKVSQRQDTEWYDKQAEQDFRAKWGMDEPNYDREFRS